MLKKLARKLLMRVAEKLGRYAQSLEKYLAEENLPERDRASVNSNDEPPAHWLAKIRQGAPHLLDQTTSPNDPTTFHFETGDQSSQPLSSHYRKQIDRSGEQETLLNPSFSSTQSPGFSNHSEQKLSGRANSKNLFEPVKKLIDRLLPITADSSKRSEMDSKDLLQKIDTGQNDSSNSTENTILKNKTSPFRKMQLNEFGQKKSSSQFQKIDTSSSNKSKPKLQSTSVTYHLPDANKSKFNKKASQQPEYTPKKTPRKNQHTIYLHPAPKIKNETNHEKRNNRAKNSRNELNTPASSIKERINKISRADQKRTIKPKTKETSNFLLSDPAQTNIGNQHNVENNQTTIQSVFFNPAPEAIKQKQKLFESYNTSQFNSDFSPWPDLPDEVKLKTNQDLWPQLPQEERHKPIEPDHHLHKFWQLQEEMKRQSLSEQEQRGKLWSG